jgi:hypothetical protein
MDKRQEFVCKEIDKKHGIEVIKFFVHDTNKRNFVIYRYNLISLLHVSASLTPSSGNVAANVKHVGFTNCD